MVTVAKLHKYMVIYIYMYIYKFTCFLRTPIYMREFDFQDALIYHCK